MDGDPLLAERTDRSENPAQREKDGLIWLEHTWCVRDCEPSDRVSISRWRHANVEGVAEFVSDDEHDFHVLTIPLKKTAGELVMGDRLVWTAARHAERAYLTGPKRGHWHARFFDDFDYLRVWLSQELLAEAYEAQFGCSPGGNVALFDICEVEDDELLHLARTFRTLPEHDAFICARFVGALGLALAVRLVQLHYASAGQHHNIAALASQRLRQVIEFIETNLGLPLYLSELGNMAGMSRIQFASQFKAATGNSPYAYIQQRRIARAKERLAHPAARIVDVALDVGFSSQSHFTEAFRRAVGLSPGKWRLTQDISGGRTDLEPD